MASSPLPRAVHGDPDRPLRIGKLSIPCYVLDNDLRVITCRGFSAALDRGSSASGGAPRLAHFARSIAPNPSAASELSLRLETPLTFILPGGGQGSGYDATLLADMCDVILEARATGKLDAQQLHMAERAELLMRSWAMVGIIAMVDEATGYQSVRRSDALEELLDKFLTDTLMAWAKTFPDEFYIELYRLKGWQFSDESQHARPGVVGSITRDIVYSRLAPGVIQELERRNPPVRPGQRKDRHHQWLTPDFGHPKLREHLAAVMALMRASKTYEQFYRSLKAAFPRQWDQLDLHIPNVADN